MQTSGAPARAAKELRDIARWYGSKSGLLVAGSAVAVVVAALILEPVSALVLAVVLGALIGPVLLMGIRRSIAQTGANATRQLEQAAAATDGLRVTTDDLRQTTNEVVAAEKLTAQRLRNSRKKTRERLNRIEADGAANSAELIAELTMVAKRTTAATEHFESLNGAVISLGDQIPELANDIGLLTTDQNEANQRAVDLGAAVNRLASTSGADTSRLRELETQTAQLTKQVEELSGALEQERSALISDGSAAHFCLAPGYRRRLALIADFSDLGNEDEWQREVYDYARGVAVQSGAKSVGDFGCGSGFKLLSRFADFETTGIDRPEIVEHLRAEHPNRTWNETGDLTPELFDAFDVIIASDVIEHLEQPDRLLDALSRSRATDIILSTPERELLIASGHRPYGPPANPHHYLEWTFDEFREFVEPWLEIVEHHVSNSSQATQLIHARRRR